MGEAEPCKAARVASWQAARGRRCNLTPCQVPPLHAASPVTASLPSHPHCHLRRSIPPPAVIEYWTFSLFYCASELWGSVVISVLFWSLANEVCTIAEAKVRRHVSGSARSARGEAPGWCD